MEYTLLITEPVAHFDGFTKEQRDVLDERPRVFVKQVEDAGAEILFSD